MALDVIVLASKKATAVEVSLDPPDRMLQHIACLARLQTPNARKDHLVPLLGPSAGFPGCGLPDVRGERPRS